MFKSYIDIGTLKDVKGMTAVTVKRNASYLLSTSIPVYTVKSVSGSGFVINNLSQKYNT